MPLPASKSGEQNKCYLQKVLPLETHVPRTLQAVTLLGKRNFASESRDGERTQEGPYTGVGYDAQQQQEEM